MKVINLQERRDKMDAETFDGIIEELDKLKEAAKEGRLHQFVLQYDVETDIKDNDEEPLEARHVVFWNKNDNLDEIIGFSERLLFRLNLIAEASE